MSFFKSIFGSKTDYAQLIEQGTTIIDVRTAGEFSNGSLPGSKNFALKEINVKMSSLDKRKPLIIVCASGIRSGVAKRILKSMGFQQVHNGGSWASLLKYF